MDTTYHLSTPMSAVDEAWERLLATSRECGIDSQAWTLVEPERPHHWLLHMAGGPHGDEVRPIGRGRSAALAALKALEAILRHTPEWQAYRDATPEQLKSQREKKRSYR